MILFEKKLIFHVENCFMNNEGVSKLNFRIYNNLKCEYFKKQKGGSY